MWDRRTIKEKGKAAFKRNYWMCVLVAFLLVLSTGGGSPVSLNTGTNYESMTNETISNESMLDETAIFDELLSSPGMPDGIMGVTVAIVLVVLLVILIISLILGVFVFGPLEVGCCNFFKKNAYEHTDFNTVGIGYKKENYKNIVITMFFRNLYTVLWSLLFLVPGIIKAYEYRMIPYLLADCPDMPKKDAFRISREMMYGNKMDAFILDLSFFGWNLLSAITCGAVGLFYVNPYISATNAELFIAIREEYFAKLKSVEEQVAPVCE